MVWKAGKDPDAGRVWGQEDKGTTEDEMAGWHHRLDGHIIVLPSATRLFFCSFGGFLLRRLSGLQEIRVGAREESAVLCFPSRRGLTPRGINTYIWNLGACLQGSSGDADIKNRLVNKVRKEVAGANRECSSET